MLLIQNLLEIKYPFIFHYACAVVGTLLMTYLLMCVLAISNIDSIDYDLIFMWLYWEAAARD